MDTQLLNQYSLILSQVKNIEIELEKKIKTLIQKSKIEQYRPRDFGRRGFPLDIFFDLLNIDFFSEKNVKEFQKLLVNFEELRNKQKTIETEIDKMQISTPSV